MDIYCPRCAEPWDNDTFHEVAEERGSSYAEVVSDFQARGCEALGTTHNEVTSDAQRLRADVSAMLMELGDMDGAMAELDDFESLGLFDQ